MRLHFANSATVRTRARLVSPKGGLGLLDLQVRYGLLEHPSLGPVIIDGGYSNRITQGTWRSPALKLYARALAPRIHEGAHPAEVLRRLGYDPQDVRHVIVSHLHADHLGYLHLFSHAEFHIGTQCGAWLSRRGRASALRNGIFPELLPEAGATQLRFFEAGSLIPVTESLNGHDVLGDASVLALPLPGHATGHFGLYFPQVDAPLLYGVDAAWTLPALLDPPSKSVPAALISNDRHAASNSTAALAAFARAGGRVALCHDPAPLPEDIDFSLPARGIQCA